MTEEEPTGSDGEGGAPPGPASAGDPTDAPDAPERPVVRTRVPRWLALLAAGLFVGCLALAILAASLAGQLDDERRDRREVTRVTGEVASALFTYDHEQLGRTRDRVLAVATGKFRREYEATFPSLEKLLVETKATATATVKDVFVSDITDGSASAIAVVDASVAGLGGTNRRADSYLRVRLLKVDGRWRVDDALSINFGSAPAATPPTTAPPEPAPGG